MGTAAETATRYSRSYIATVRHRYRHRQSSAFGGAVVAADGVENETRYSGKIGAAAALSSSVGVYGELSALTADDSLDLDNLGVGGKLGVKYSF